MCLLSYYPPGVLPDVDALFNGAVLNTDGHGFAVVANTRLLVGHGLDAAAVIAEFLHIRQACPDGAALFHSRFATHGAVTEDNCHPFRVGGDPRTMLAHNGVLPKRVRPKRSDRRCDTRIAAEDFLPREPFGSLASPRGRAGLQNWLGLNRLVILTVDDRHPDNAYLLGEELGVWSGGAWYSNTDFHDTAERFAWEPGAYPCPVCESLDSLDTRTGWCQVCGICADCGDDVTCCDCFIPDTPSRWTPASNRRGLSIPAGPARRT